MKVYALLVVLVIIDVALAMYATLEAPYPLHVTLGAPTAYLNIYLHIPMAWGSYLLYTGALISAILYLARGKEKYDILTYVFVVLATVYAVFTLVSGMAWASESWGAAWSWDPRETGVLLLLLAYLVYFALRSSIPDPDRAATLSSVYAVAAYSMVPISFIAPRLAGSLHPTPKEFGGFMGRPEVMAVFGPRILLASAIALLLVYINYKLYRGELRTPAWLKYFGVLLIVFGVVAGLYLAKPYLEGCADRVVDVKLADSVITALSLADKGYVEFSTPIKSPVQPPRLEDGRPTIIGYIVCVKDSSIDIVRHWSVAFNYAAYAFILGTIILYLSRQRSRSPEQP
jgi:ABC-type transport system involved in cytochrome c biogenesis permease subunit